MALERKVAVIRLRGMASSPAQWTSRKAAACESPARQCRERMRASHESRRDDTGGAYCTAATRRKMQPAARAVARQAEKPSSVEAKETSLTAEPHSVYDTTILLSVR